MARNSPAPPPDLRRICLDSRSLQWPDGTGVSHYARGIVAGLETIGWICDMLRPGPPAGRGRNRLRAVWPGPVTAVPDAAGWEARDLFRLAQVHFDVHRRLLDVRSARPPGLMHWTYPVPLAFRGTVNVYTIHDLIPLTHPAVTDIDPVRFARIVRAIARRADHVVTVSETSRREIVALLGMDELRVTNTGQAAEMPGSLRGAAPPARTGHFVFCGTIERRKNLFRLIAAHRASGTDRPLVLIGPDGFGAAGELSGAEIRPLDAMPRGLAGGVFRAPFLPRAALLEVLRGARALLFPSLAEGFGRPIAEAMAVGVPVLTSAGGATAETAGGAALLVDPCDTAAMTRAIAALAADDALCQRLTGAGLRRAASFTQDAATGRLIAAYDTVWKQPP